MALYHKWDVKKDFAYVLQFFSLISDSLGSVNRLVLFWGQKRDDYFNPLLILEPDTEPPSIYIFLNC